ncbi:MAG: undecaprenyldiphospho-muramoylpentapeptide beta-N-acetylglucosaminyltransferase [Akkermansiaceae bacterium]|nr:undecaprenyldiphospho-muramoylpentapeptide beta-N-acetylglucosaminyltransferase [Akkermansiaceae bacterium]MDP4646547.1 undecaprenyldiphospho-muramoylpentapeptide beta-N-acetylglucosaminyltransferase [Akkermansiaceae bacterium]MDP4781101.1 undecaprenyldiphospho-muramoylpentapeptide beta-N-acetylglucosaminyltransferase [Akkermansiaceae bacterium]MDP4846456.1 undecaprenyldiphospho-muramoylpentapeptide beta-N-acetylglucosaminyltransferase [Akkermansiaceae bacterium]MDP4896757.1 undecaprenyldiph
MKILIACGGTGGHLFPGIAVAESLLAQGHKPLLLISQKKIDAQASAKYPHLSFKVVPAIAKPPTLSPKMLPFMVALWKSIRSSKKIIRDFGADAVLGMGGFTSLPPVYAGHRLGKKTYVHDSNARPGRANILTSRFCTEVFIGLEPAAKFFKTPTLLTGTPARPEIINLPSRDQAAAKFGLDPDKTTLLVTGGSQGALQLNRLIAQAAPSLPENIQILHIAGPGDYERIRSENPKRRPGYHLMGFCDQMPSAYALADLAIARSGASTLTELSLAGLPSVLVPYPYAADDHQTANARVFSTAGAAKLIQEKDLTPESLAKLLTDLLTNPGTLNAMSEAAKSLAIADAAERVSMEITAQ